MNPPNKPILNNVKNRFLPIPEAVAKCWEPEPKLSDFDIIKEVGTGSFGHVFLVVHKETKYQYAIKAIDKRNKTNIEEKPYFRREIEIMYKIHHPGVVRLYSHFEDDNYCYFIMEYINKGNIYNLIPKDKTKRWNTQIVASIMKDIISAVYFLHQMEPPIVHRDIKPENVWLAEGTVAKWTDFGWSNYMSGEEKRTTVCGTPIYLAPEIINEAGHDEKVDIWCIGVLLFELVTGTVPFGGNDIETLKKNIQHMKIVWPRDISMDTKNLIMKILKYDPRARISWEDMLKHPFFTKYFPNASQSLIKPDQNIEYAPFVVSKDNPKKDLTIKDNSAKNEGEGVKAGNTENSDNVDNGVSKDTLQAAYESLQREYEKVTKENLEWKDILKEKEEKIRKLIKATGSPTKQKPADDSEKVEASIGVTQGIDQEIQRMKEEHALAIEKEKKKFININSKYENLVTWSKDEVKSLKTKIKEWESKLSGNA